MAASATVVVLAGCGASSTAALPAVPAAAPDGGVDLLRELTAVSKYTAPPRLVDSVKDDPVPSKAKRPAPVVLVQPKAHAAVVVLPPINPPINPPSVTANSTQKPRAKKAPAVAKVTVSGTVRIPYQFDSFAGPLPSCAGVAEFARIRIGAPVLFSDGSGEVAEGSVTSCA